jgi:PAS domain S-box-containing protein
MRSAISLGSAGGIAIAYFLAARLGLALISASSNLAVFWPASGVAAGILIVLGRRALPALVVGVVMGTVAADFLSDIRFVASLLNGFWDAGEAVLAAWLLERWFGRPFTFGDLRRVAGFVAAASFATAASATLGAATMIGLHAQTAAPYSDVWCAWFLSGWVGFVVVAPLIIELGQLRRELLSWAGSIEGIGVLALMALTSVYVVTHPSGSWISFDPDALVLPLLLWLTARCQPPFGVAGAFVASITIIYAMTFGIGGFGDVDVPVTERVRGAQMAVTMVTLCTLVLAALFAERKKVEEELRRSEAKFAGILEIAGDAIISMDANHRITLFNEAAEGLFGYLRGEMVGRPMDLLIPARFRVAHQQHMERFTLGPDILRRMAGHREVPGLRKNGEEFPIEASISKVKIRGEWVSTVVLRDITERKRAEEHHRILLRELDHRVKNALTTVSSVIFQTHQSSKSLVDFVEALDGRIRSMARTHELLSFSRWQGVSMAELVRRELAPYATRDNTEINGPDVVVHSEAGQVLAMVLHELATNAAKYGALSSEAGRVSVRWYRESSGSEPSHLVLGWQEVGGPPVAAPGKPSYGTTTVRDLIPYELGGTVEFVLAPGGAWCRLELPANWLGNDSQPVAKAVAHASSRTI